MVDYKTNSLNLYLSTSYAPMEQLTVFGNINYSKSKAELDQVVMPDITDLLYNEVRDATDLTHQDFTFAEMHEYSNLDYALLGLNLGMEYRFTGGVVLTLDGTYYDLNDKAGFVYGDESGSYFLLRSGVRFEF